MVSTLLIKRRLLGLNLGIELVDTGEPGRGYLVGIHTDESGIEEVAQSVRDREGAGHELGFSFSVKLGCGVYAWEGTGHSRQLRLYHL